MKNATDFTATFKDIMGAFPIDTSAMDSAFKSTATLNEKLSAAALGAAEKSSAVSSKWATDTFAKMSDMSKAKSEPADYAKSITDFASGAAEASAEHMATFAEIAKKFQAETVELMMAAGKNMSEEAQSVAQKASADVTTAAKKLSAK